MVRRGWRDPRNTERVWKLVIFAGQLPDSVGREFFQKTAVPRGRIPTLKIELFLENETFPFLSLSLPLFLLSTFFKFLFFFDINFVI